MLHDLKCNRLIFAEKFMRREGLAEVWELAKTCRLGSIQNRLNSWRVFLGIFKETEDTTVWMKSLETFRTTYQSLKLQHLTNDSNLKQKISNSENVIKNKTNPEHLFEVVKIWSEVHQLELKEEVIDIAEIVLYVVTYEKYNEDNNQQTSEVLSVFNNFQFIQSDAFQIFSEIMKLGVLPLKSSVTIKKKHETTILDLKCERVYNYYLKSLDPELYKVLELNEIPVKNYLW
jgi:hypothetical protein